MSYLETESGYNMYDMLSMIQKSIRRGDYENAGYAANQLKGKFRTAMWNRLFVISAEDCYGILTKELVELRRLDGSSNDDSYIANALALMCRSEKSRDACYFSCNFILASRKPRDEKPDISIMNGIVKRFSQKNSYDSFGFEQMSVFEEYGLIDEYDKNDKYYPAASLELSIQHRDMDMIGFWMDYLRRYDRIMLWDVLEDYAENLTETELIYEIKGLRIADDLVNGKRKGLDKDEIFTSKSVMLLCQANDSSFENLESCEIVKQSSLIDWSHIKIKPISECRLGSEGIPEWVYDCHTIKGKQMGKTDWDMTRTEQDALYPLHKAYFDDASWIYTYEQDFDAGRESIVGMRPIREYAKTHSANPVEFIPY